MTDPENLQVEIAKVLQEAANNPKTSDVDTVIITALTYLVASTPPVQPAGIAEATAPDTHEAIRERVAKYYRDWRNDSATNSYDSADAALKAVSSAGIHYREVARLRRIEDALIACGSPNRSEPDDPGGLTVAWIWEKLGRPDCPVCGTRDYERFDLATRSGKCVNKHHVGWDPSRKAWYCPDGANAD